MPSISCVMSLNVIYGAKGLQLGLLVLECHVNCTGWLSAVSGKLQSSIGGVWRH